MGKFRWVFLGVFLTILLSACNDQSEQVNKIVQSNNIEQVNEDKITTEETEEYPELQIYAEYVTNEELEEREKKREEERKQRREETKKAQLEKKNQPKLKPFIGMTDYEALESTWGKPKKINKTTNAFGVREQWVYDGYRYLYFENGYLTTIQE